MIKVHVILDNRMTREDLEYSGFNPSDYGKLHKIMGREYTGNLTDEQYTSLKTFVNMCPIGHLFKVYVCSRT